MNKRPYAWFLIALLIGTAAGPAIVAADADAILADELTLRAAGLTTDGPGLLDFFRRRTQVSVAPDRLKAVSFTGPAWWYGPAIAVPKGNPANLHAFDGLKGKRIGAIAGSAADEYLRTIGVTVTAFQTDAEEFGAVSSGRVDGIVEDDVKVLAFLSANTSAGIEIVPNVAVPDDLIFKYGYGYARYALRKEDCSLRVAFTQGLAEIRGNGEVSAILKKYGLSNRNLFFFPL